VRFWDASGLIPLCLDDPATPLMRGLVREDQGIAVWWGTAVECCSAFIRLRRQGILEAAGLENARHVLDGLAGGWTEVVPAQDVRDQAIRLLGLHPLRAADALQLSGAFIWADRHPFGRHFVCLDVRLRDAARAEGFVVLPREWR